MRKRARAGFAAPEAPSTAVAARRLWPYAAAAAVASFLVFSNCIRGTFVWDDDDFVVRNVFLNSWSGVPHLLRNNLVEGVGAKSNLYRPMEALTHFLDVRLWGYRPAGHRLTNVLLHAAASAAAFRWLAGFASPPAALAAAALYALHPLQSEAVGYVSGRSDTLGVLFLCLGLVAFKRRPITALACATAAVLSKENFVLFPVFLWLSETAAGRAATRCRLLPFWLLSAVYVALRLSVLNFSDTLNFYGAHNLFTDHVIYRIYTYLTTLPEGLRLWAWPSDLHHERSWAVYASPLLPRVWLSTLGAGLWLSVAARLWARERPGTVPAAPPSSEAASEPKVAPGRAVAAGLLWFAAATLPTSNLLAVINALFYDHWFLVPGLGLALAVTQVDALPEPPRTSALALCTLLAVACAGLARRQNEVWRDPASLFSHILRYEPRNAKAHGNLAMALEDAGDLREAVRHYELSIALSDEYPQNHHNLGRLYARLGDLDRAEAEFRKAVAMSPSFFPPLVELGWLELNRGRPDAAAKAFEQALRSTPYAAKAYLGLAQLRLNAGDSSGAQAILLRGLEAAPDSQLAEALRRLTSASAGPRRP